MLAIPANLAVLLVKHDPVEGDITRIKELGHSALHQARETVIVHHGELAVGVCLLQVGEMADQLICTHEFLCMLRLFANRSLTVCFLLIVVTHRQYLIRCEKYL